MLRDDLASCFRPVPPEPEPPPSVGARVTCSLSDSVRVEGVIVAQDGPLRFVAVERRLERRDHAGSFVSAFVPRRDDCGWDLAVDVRQTAVTALD